MKHSILSLCMIVKDEENDLHKCLQSAQGLVDEIVVVDTGSRDTTPQVAQKFGAKVYSFKWINDFAAARNESIKHATGDYILWLDADDRIPESERKKFLQWKRALSTKEKKAYFFIIESLKGDKFLTERCYQLRVFPRLPGVRFVRRVHESVHESLRALQVPTAYSDVRILHVGYARKEDMRRKATRNLKLLLTALAEAPKDPTIHWHLSMTYNVLEEKEKSARHAEILLSLLPKDLKKEENEWKIAVMAHLANLYGDLGREEEAEDLLKKALELDPDDPLATFFLAKLLMKRCAYEEALPVLQSMKRKRPQISQVPFPQEAVQFYTHLWLGQCYEALGEREKALEEYAAAQKVNPRWRDRGTEIGEFYLRRGEIDKALSVLKEVYREDPFDPSVLSNLGLAYRRKGDLQKAEEFFKKALELEPEHFDALANLGHLLLLEGRLKEASSYLERASCLRGDLDLEAALVVAKVLQGEIEDSLTHTERLMEALKVGKAKALDGFADYARLLHGLAEALKDKRRPYEARLLLLASEHLLQQEALASSS